MIIAVCKTYHCHINSIYPIKSFFFTQWKDISYEMTDFVHVMNTVRFLVLILVNIHTPLSSSPRKKQWKNVYVFGAIIKNNQCFFPIEPVFCIGIYQTREVTLW